ncbi:MAG: DNA-3-methyladenine glycosylase I [Parafilimonas sp.]
MKSRLYFKLTTAFTMANTFCEAVQLLDKNNFMRVYHDSMYGYPVIDDKELFERLILEINQAGLSWATILKKQQNFRKAFHQFNIEKVAAYKEADRQRLLNDEGIIRNRLKIDAAIHNANIILQLQKEYGSFKNWLDANHSKTKEGWMALFKKTFKFTGGEIVNEFLVSSGYLQGAHDATCPVYKKVLKTKPVWLSKKK